MEAILVSLKLSCAPRTAQRRHDRAHKVTVNVQGFRFCVIEAWGPGSGVGLWDNGLGVAFLERAFGAMRL